MRLIIRLLTPLVLLLAMLLPAGGAIAAPAESVRTEDIWAAVNGCNTEEFIVLEGTVQIVSQVREDGSALTYVTYQMNGVGDQGNRYVLNLTFMVRFRSSTGYYSADQSLRLVSEGSAPNQWLIVHFDSDDVSTFEIDCRG
jgi:hypothetical protein